MTIKNSTNYGQVQIVIAIQIANVYRFRFIIVEKVCNRGLERAVSIA